MTSPGMRFEAALTAGLNTYAEINGIDAVAFRRYNPYKQPQEFDVLVDSRQMKYYCCFECKSAKIDKFSGLYFIKHFAVLNGEHQLNREMEWAARAGRRAFLAIELRGGTGHPSTAYIIQLRKIWKCFESGEKKYPLRKIVSDTAIHRSDGEYLITSEVFNGINGLKPVDRP